jgi:hypothetical protein
VEDRTAMPASGGVAADGAVGDRHIAQ